MDAIYTIYAHDPSTETYYRLRLTRREFMRYDNSAMISIGLKVADPSVIPQRRLSRRKVEELISSGRGAQVSRDEWQHSGCQSRCVRRGDETCRW